MANRAFLTLLGLLLLVPLGCGGGDDSNTDTTRKTGIGGVVVDGNPYSETNYYQKASPLPPGRANARVFVYVGDGVNVRQVAEGRSGSDGRFFIPLQPGGYRIHAQRPGTESDSPFAPSLSADGFSPSDVCSTGDIVTVTDTQNAEIALGYADCNNLSFAGLLGYLSTDGGGRASYDDSTKEEIK
ncbi:MAG: hypothetical protein H7Y38_20440 [Armatimonadetes bacterium]|nr:hypothetical protein [Armatimonadota bacterium]